MTNGTDLYMWPVITMQTKLINIKQVPVMDIFSILYNFNAKNNNCDITGRYICSILRNTLELLYIESCLVENDTEEVFATFHNYL